jgi:SWI/SNF-related matrix-associated actin-dependent regulator of chromatin subfamily A member 5
LVEKYSTVGLDDLQKFSLDAPNTYEWEGEDYSKKRAVGLNWIEPAKRERKANYAIDDYYRETFGITQRG